VTLNLKRIPTGPYSQFVDELRRALIATDKAEITSLLDGVAGRRCLELLNPDSIRQIGAFFTPSVIANRLVEQFSVDGWENEVVFDPACGAGDLLLSVARRLPLKRTVSTTLRFWNRRLVGCDVSREFIEAAKLRLVLLAVSRGARLDGLATDLCELLTNIYRADGLALSYEYARSTCVIMNPPYGRVISSPQPWRNGSVTAAALFVERAVTRTRPGAQISTLLPEVLRTGTSYAAWRTYISNFAVSSRPEPLGLFSKHADVDVYIQYLDRRNLRYSVLPRTVSRSSRPTVGDHFNVSVGAVIPHRHLSIGPDVAYLRAQTAAPWSEIKRVRERRRFDGRLYQPPFVVVRRTSRSGDSQRAIASLVIGRRAVAVENHLIVATPKSGSAQVCRKLMHLLRSKDTDNWLNRHMCCRHLTTISVSSLPWK
jgi:hypothetical protein